MNDRLTNDELRTAIRETERTCGVTVSAANREAVEHLAALRMVERKRATALFAAAGEKEDPATYEDCVSAAVHNAVMYRLQVDFDALKSKLSACERERDALKRRLEPLTGSELHSIAAVWGPDESRMDYIDRVVCQVDEIRARRA